MHQAMRLITALVVVVLGTALYIEQSAAADSESIRHGEEQLANRDFHGAIETLSRAVADAPTSSLARTRLGGAYLLDGQYPLAIEQFQQAISTDPGNADAFVGMAVAYLHSGRLPLARAALVEAKRIDPGKAERIDEVVGWIDVRSNDPHNGNGSENRGEPTDAAAR